MAGASNTISHHELSFWVAASAQRALAATVRARPPAGRARPSPLHIKKALASKWYYMKFVAPVPYGDGWVMGLYAAGHRLMIARTQRVMERVGAR